MKKIVAALLAVLMITTMLPVTAVAQTTTPVAFTVSSEVKTAEEGDLVEFTVTMGSVTELPMAGIDFMLSIPEGLTYVAGSGKVANGLKEKFGAYDTSFTEKTLKFISVGGGEYTGTSDITLMTFKCKVNGEVDKASVEVTLKSARDYPVDMIGPVQSNGNIEDIPTAVTGCKLFLGGFIPGDADNSGEVDMDDAMEIMRYYVGWDVEINLAAADVNGDGVVDMDDAMEVMRYYVGWDVDWA